MMKHLYSLLALVFVCFSATAQVTELTNNIESTGGGISIGNRIIFFRTGTNYKQLASTDGTAAGTIIIPSTTVELNGAYAVLGNKLIFSGYNASSGTELWITDGTIAGTTLVKDIYPGAVSSTPTSSSVERRFNVVGNVIYFTAYDPAASQELFKSDGTTSGTVLVKDIYPGNNSSQIDFPVPTGNEFIGNTFFFTAYTPATGGELWKTDGTTAGTVMVKEINAGNAGTSYGRVFAGNGTYIFMSVSTDGIQYKLWRTDGTDAGTIMLENPSTTTTGNIPLYGGMYHIFNGEIYYQAPAQSGNQLWKSNGTVAGTVLVKDFNPSGAGLTDLLNAVTVGNKFYFPAETNVGTELIASDGTTAGTGILVDLNGSSSSFPTIFINYNGSTTRKNAPQYLLNGNKFFFYAYTTTNGRELYVSDGTAAGTTLVKDINPGGGGSSVVPSGATASYSTLNRLYFFANNGTNGAELWQSDGTAAGTTLVQDINPTGNSHWIEMPFYGVAGNKLVFTATDNGTDHKAYAVNNSVVLPVSSVVLTAALKAGGVVLNWNVKQGNNLSHFNIERMTEAGLYQQIGTMTSPTTISNADFSYNDALLQQGSTGFYRIAVTDRDGKKTYSNVVKIKSAEEVRFTVQQGRDQLILNFIGVQGKTNVKIIAANGAVIAAYALNVNNNQPVTLPTHLLSKGVYFVTSEYNGTVYTQKFIR